MADEYDRFSKRLGSVRKNQLILPGFESADAQDVIIHAKLLRERRWISIGE
jgi:hypothetical protein